ncbi:MAG TPA: iron-sulfur cluster assembly accessory protein [Dehalococcoidia bacterium]|nr:iron-sulfur cluster assembly accessory protein [Dehalococcoidia bacterium]
MSTANDFGTAPEQDVLTITDAAKSRIQQVMESKDLTGHSLRVSIRGRGATGFEYGMTFEGPEEKHEGDTVFDAGVFTVLIDADTLRHAQGARIDFADGGFQIDNPNPIWDDPRALTVQALLDEQINPAVARHGGFVQLMDVKDDTVYVLLGGGCQGCGMVDVTLKQGIEVLIKEALPEIEHVVDTTDHAGGTNPYYEPEKK